MDSPGLTNRPRLDGDEGPTPDVWMKNLVGVVSCFVTQDGGLPRAACMIRLRRRREAKCGCGGSKIGGGAKVCGDIGGDGTCFKDGKTRGGDGGTRISGLNRGGEKSGSVCGGGACGDKVEFVALELQRNGSVVMRRVESEGGLSGKGADIIVRDKLPSWPPA